MSSIKKALLLGAALAVIVAVGGGTASAATTDFSCNVSGKQSAGTWSASCTSGIGNVKCSGTSSGTQDSGTLSGTCSGSSIFGRTTCTASGSYRSSADHRSWTGNIRTDCRAGVTTANCSGSGGGTANPSTTAYKGTLTGTCTY